MSRNKLASLKPTDQLTHNRVVHTGESLEEILEHQIPRRYNQSFGSKLCHSEELSWCCSLLGKQILPESAPTALTSHSHFLTFQRDATYIHATVVEDIYTILTLIFTEHNENEDNDNKCNDNEVNDNKANNNKDNVIKDNEDNGNTLPEAQRTQGIESIT